MELSIRQETSADYSTVFDLIEQAFRNETVSDKKEQFLVERLRKSDSFIPELSLVAEVNHEIVGYILLTKITIETNTESIISLALAPVAVLPAFQNKGIGGKLIEEAHHIAKELGYQSIILLGHEKYYPKFGYQLLHPFNISLPFDAPKENCMAIELVVDALKNKEGKVNYPKEFFE
ncbi:MAG: N-acetyltransferase [Chitinophagales bacterium]|nr:N-acetyltransferase [Chitinophagales bacterium]MCZ2394209.1 N-acetyltransferase [Chitinophagales bacterium]